MISIVIPVYNVAQYLNECLQSVANQTYTDWECILVDDGSTDGSSEICDEWGKKDSRFVVYHQVNGGVSKARNYGIGQAKGDFITFIDSDDWVESNYLSEMVMWSVDVDIVVSGFWKEDDICCTTKNVPIYSSTFTLTPNHVAAFVSLNENLLFYAPWGKLYRTSIIKDYAIRFPENCFYGEDLQFNYTYLEYVINIAQVSVANYHYRKVEGSASLSTTYRPNQFQQDYEQWHLLRKFYERHGLWLQPAKELLYKRLWGIVYDGLFSTNTNKRQILSIPEIQELKDYQTVFSCSGWIKWCILHKIAFVFR